MPILRPEWRLLTPRADLEALGEYLSTLEDQLDYLRAQWDVRLRVDLGAADDDERDWLYFERRLKDSHVVTPLRSGFVLAFWSVYSGGIHHVATHLMSNRGVKQALADAEGRDLFAKWRRYFADRLGLELHPELPDWTSVKVLQAVRNTFAHANGRPHEMSRRVQSVLSEGLRRDIGLREGDEGLYLEDRYLSESYHLVDGLLRSLIERALDLDDHSASSSATALHQKPPIIQHKEQT